MPGRVEADPHPFLGLNHRQRRAGADGMLHGGIEIVDPDVKVLRGVLSSRLARPDGRRPLCLVLEVEGRLAAALR